MSLASASRVSRARGLVAGRAELGQQPAALLVGAAETRAELGHLRLELAAHLLQRLDVAPQLDQLAELELDLFLAGLGRLLRRRELALQLPLAHLVLARLDPHLVQGALHQRLILGEGRHLLGELGARRLALAQVGRQRVPIQERLL